MFEGRQPCSWESGTTFQPLTGKLGNSRKGTCVESIPDTQHVESCASKFKLKKLSKGAQPKQNYHDSALQQGTVGIQTLQLGKKKDIFSVSLHCTIHRPTGSHFCAAIVAGAEFPCRKRKGKKLCLKKPISLLQIKSMFFKSRGF